MKCPNCGEEVEQGFLFCPRCLTEIPWVAEYNTMETLQIEQEYNRNKQIQRIKRRLESDVLPKRQKRATLVFLCCLGIGIASLGAVGYHLYWNYNSYGYQYHKAVDEFYKGDYDSALEHIDRANALEDTHEEAYRLLAEILSAQGDLEGAIKVMETSMVDFPSSEVLYGELLSLYERNKEPEKIKELLDDCDSPAIRRQYSSYITPDPVISHTTGTYDEEFSVEISGDCDCYYYTFKKKKDPSYKTKRYTKPIKIPEGTTQLKVIGYSKEGIPSDIIYRKYVVAPKAPANPVFTPQEAYFDKPTTISIKVDEGSKCYYAFDELPDTDSTQYTGPIDMPEGSHTLTAFAVGANGEQSAYVSKTYTLTY